MLQLVRPTINAELISGEYFVQNYEKYLSRYVAKSRPSSETLTAYRQGIKQYLSWCEINSIDPMKVTDFEVRVYIENLYRRGLKDASVSLYFVSIRTFYNIGVKLGLLLENPCSDVAVANSRDQRYEYYTPEQIRKIYDVIMEETDEFKRTRNLTIFFLMAVQGLRSVEVQRLNDEDISFFPRRIFIRGKGHCDYVYPCDDTIDVIAEYLCKRGEVKKEYNLTPTIVNSHTGKRLEKRTITRLTSEFLTKAGVKIQGTSCHSLRHSCGTNLYAKTKDIRLVQATLRHKSPEETARYVHEVEMQENQATQCISPLQL